MQLLGGNESEASSSLPQVEQTAQHVPVGLE